MQKHMTQEMVQSKGKDHKENLFHYGLVKVIVLHQLSQFNISWETFLESNSFMPTTSQPTSHSTRSAPLRPHEVGSSINFSVRKTLGAEIT